MEQDSTDEEATTNVEQFTFGGDLGVALGSPVTTNSTTNRTNDYKPTCVSNSSAPDMSYTWTAPSAGTFTFTTLGSSFDTVLEVRQYNTGASLGCNDDSNSTLQSAVSVSLSAGQTVIIVVDGYGSANGTFQLNINGSSGRHYTCGYAIAGYGCNNGRNHAFVITLDMATAVPACRSVQPGSYPDFCYVIDGDGAVPSDVTQCQAAGGSWRSGNNCCNFMGSLSCP
ncbi:MAG TPA: hypothetical protein VN253_15645 [Kofleriaceae bacterium]|nr:hypothetical protein [Kofleriaceae bacterium]